MTQPHDAPRRGTALPCRSAADQPDSNHQAQLTSLVRALHRCAPGPQDQPDPSNSSLSSPLYCIRLIRTLKYLLTKSYRYVIFRFAERESRMCVSRPSHCHRKSLKSSRSCIHPLDFPFTRSRNPFVFRRSHTLHFMRSATHSFRTTCALFRKTPGYTSLRPKTELDFSRSTQSLLFTSLARPRRIQICLYLGSLFSFRLSFDQEGPL
jgi:hypothetical protein